MATPSNKSKLTIDVPAHMKRQLKVYCAVNQLNMTDVVEELLRAFLESAEKGAS